MLSHQQLQPLNYFSHCAVWQCVTGTLNKQDFQGIVCFGLHHLSRLYSLGEKFTPAPGQKPRDLSPTGRRKKMSRSDGICLALTKPGSG